MSTSIRTKKVGVIGVAATVAIIALMFAYPVIASGTLVTPSSSEQASSSSSTSTTSSQSTTSPPSVTIQFPQPTPLTVGEQITFTGTQGEYRNLTTNVPPSAAPRSTNAVFAKNVGPTAVGPAAGTIVFTVTGVLHNGYTLTLTSGSLALGATTISLTGGSAVIGIEQAGISGSGTAGSGGSMIFQGYSHSSFWGSAFSTFSLDLQSGGHEYLVQLLVTVSHS